MKGREEMRNAEGEMGGEGGNMNRRLGRGARMVGSRAWGVCWSLL